MLAKSSPKMNIGTILKVIVRLFKLAWQAHPRICMATIGITILQGVSPVGSAWITKLIFDLLVENLQSFNQSIFIYDLLPLLLLQAVIGVIIYVSGSIGNYLSNELTRHLTVQIQTKIYQKISGFAGLAYFENPAFFNLVHLGEQGGMLGVTDIIRTLTSIIQSLLVLGSFLSAMLLFGPLLAVFIILTTIPKLLIQSKISKQRVGLAFDLSPDERKIFYLSQLLSGIETAKEIRLFGLGKHFLSKLRLLYHSIHQAKRLQEQHELRWAAALETLSNLLTNATFAVIIWYAFLGQITVGSVTFFTSSLRNIQGVLSTLVLTIARLNEYTLFFAYYEELMALPEPLPLAKKPKKVKTLQSAIILRNVSFRYSDAHPWILQDINLTIPHGKCLAIVGKNGAGKTTLVKLVTRLYDPTHGQILWDDTDIRHLDITQLRSRIGITLQDFVHYDLSAKENIGMGNIEQLGNMTKIERAAQKAGIHERIMHLPHTYQTVLSRWLSDDEIGTDLSGGEWQKVALARMFMREADLLILDEPTAALDIEAEHALFQDFKELVAGQTSLLISHRFSTVKMADVIAVLKDGYIVEYGSHQELMALNGEYAELYSMQEEKYLHVPEPI